MVCTYRLYTNNHQKESEQIFRDLSTLNRHCQAGMLCHVFGNKMFEAGMLQLKSLCNLPFKFWEKAEIVFCMKKKNKNILWKPIMLDSLKITQNCYILYFVWKKNTESTCRQKDTINCKCSPLHRKETM